MWIKTFAVIVLIFGLTQNSLSADEITGEMVYANKLKRTCNVNGDVFAKKFTKAQWTEFYKNKQLNQIFKENCPNVEEIPAKHLRHLYKFFLKYAKDSNEKPLC